MADRERRRPGRDDRDRLSGTDHGLRRCHDHKYDPISQREFYQFLAFFNSVSEKGVYTEQRGNVPPLISVPDPDQANQLRRLDDALAAATTAREAAGKTLAVCRKEWEQKQAAGPKPTESLDWSLRCPLDGSLHFQGPADETIEGTWRGRTHRSGPMARKARPSGLTDQIVRSWNWSRA